MVLVESRERLKKPLGYQKRKTSPTRRNAFAGQQGFA